MHTSSSHNTKKETSNLLISNIIHNVLIESFPSYYSFDTHIHKDCEFYLVLEGDCSMTITNQEFLVSAGEYVLIMPFVPHSFSVPTMDKCTCFHIHFDLDYFHGMGNSLEFFIGMDIEEYFSIHIPFYMHCQHSERLKTCCQNLLCEYQNISKETNLCNFYLLEFLLLISIDIRRNMVPSVSSDTESVYVKQALKYISENYAGKILLHDIAEHLNISVRYLTKIFHEKMHLSILAYINAYRIHQATLLMKQGVKLTDIAVQVGFSSHPHFTKTFTRIMAATPKQYRSYLMTEQYSDVG